MFFGRVLVLGFLVCGLVIQGLIVLGFQVVMMFWCFMRLFWWLFMVTCARACGFGGGQLCGSGVGWLRVVVGLGAWGLVLGYCDLVC